jgi:hypothetical protein
VEERRAVGAAERAQSALVRSAELTQRLAELRLGQHFDQSTYDHAAAASRAAFDNAALALQKAASAHHKAAELHRRLADMCEELGRTDRAAEHRRRAAEEDAEGDADEQTPRGPV